MGGKQPRRLEPGTSGRIARSAAIGKQPFRWSTGLADTGGPWGWHLASCGDILKVAIPSLQGLESWTWGQIVGDQRHNHFIDVDRLAKSAQDRLREIWTEDLPDQLVSLQMSRVTRIWGIRQGSYLQVLWWDPSHTVYPVERRT